MVLHLLDDGQLLLGGEVRHLLADLLPVGEDVLGRDHRGVVLHKVREGSRRLNSDESHTDGVEEGRRVPTTVGQVHTHVLEGLVKLVPGSLVRGLLTRLHRLGGPEVVGVVGDEVHQDLIDSVHLGPGQPVLNGGLEVRHPEPGEEGRVHLIDRVVRTPVHGSNHLGVRVESHRLPVRAIAELPVQDHLEHSNLFLLG